MKKRTKIIALYNAKGGVAKTTSVVNIGYYIARKKKRVLLIDLDPQGNLSKMAGISDENMNKTSLDILKFGTPVNEAVIQSDSLGLCIIGCNRSIVKKEEYMSITSLKQKEVTLKNALDGIKEQFDYIIIDCPPSLTELTVNALVAATHILVPFKIDSFVFDGLSELIEKVNIVKKEFNEALELTGIFVTMDNKTKVNTQVKRLLRDQFSELLFNTSIRSTSKVVESTFEQKPVAMYDPNCNASKDYLELTEEIYKRIR